jgi:hypothetical protein
LERCIPAARQDLFFSLSEHRHDGDQIRMTPTMRYSYCCNRCVLWLPSLGHRRLKRFMNYIAIVVVVLASTFGCATSKPPILDRAQALRIGMDYAHTNRWDVRSTWESVYFDPSTREWKLLFEVRPYGCPTSVYVNDKTKQVHFKRNGL